MNLINPIEYIRQDICPNCGKPELEIYDNMNKPCNFKFLIDSNNLESIKNKQVRYARCKKCWKKYALDFSNHSVQVQALEENKILEFINNIKKFSNRI